MDISICPSCQTQVLPKSDGTCPACQRAIGIDAWVPIAEPQKRDSVQSESHVGPTDSILHPEASQTAAGPTKRPNWMQWVAFAFAVVGYVILRGPLRESGLQGLIPILGGTWALLLANGVLPTSADPEQMQAWREKYGGMMNLLGPIIILYGIAQLMGFLG